VATKNGQFKDTGNIEHKTQNEDKQSKIHRKQMRLAIQTPTKNKTVVYSGVRER